MTTPNDIGWIGFALVTVAFVVTVQHVTIGQLWKKWEYPRRALGKATILLITLPLALGGILDLTTWLFFLLAYLVAGSVVVGLATWEGAKKDLIRTERVRGRIREAGQAD